MDWITCPSCGLKHSPRPDGLCPRCRTQTGAAATDSARFAPPSFDRPDSPRAPSPGAPLPTSAWGGGAPSAGQAAAAGVTVGTLLSRTFSAWWANLGRFVGALLVAYVPVFVAGLVAAIYAAQTARSVGANDPEEVQAAVIGGLLPIIVIAVLVTSILAIAQFGGITWATLQHLGSRRPRFGQITSAGFRRLGPLILASMAATVLISLGTLLLIVPGILIALALAVVLPVIMAEDVRGVGAVFRRSFALTKGSRGTLFGALLVLMVAMWGASLVGNLAAAGAAAAPALAFVGLGLSVIVQVAMSPLTAVLCAVAYHDLRLAKEGIDTSQLAKVFE